ncbi:MAG: hypothetical protein ACO3PO_01785 [Limisphaerales bacterium]
MNDNNFKKELNKFMFSSNEKEKRAIKQLADWGQEKGLLTGWIRKDVLMDPIAQSAKLYAATDGNAAQILLEYRDFIRDFQPFVTKPNFRVSIHQKDQWIEQYNWLKRILRQNDTFKLHFTLGEADWNYHNGKQRIIKTIPVLKVYDMGGVEMWLTNFEEDENKPYTDDAETANFRRLRVLMIQHDDRGTTSSTFGTYKFLREVKNFIINECGIHVLHGLALSIESDSPMPTKWRTEKADTIKFDEKTSFSVSKLEKFWARSGSFYLLPNLYGDPSRLMLVMLSNGFKTKLLHDEPSWRVFINYCDKIARKTETA